jgi:LAO/AO transport system kinase
MELAEAILAGDRLALARLLTLLENQAPQGEQTLARLYPHTGRAHRVGVTGPPGTGKSALVNQLALHLRQGGQGPRVAVVAVDPSSPFSGGALLGDRIRMRDLAGDPGVFIRSMASRGALGGLARATAAVVDALDAAGFGLIFIETVGAGQAEVDIASAAPTVIVLEAPGMGDGVTALKAGILEIGDILVVNKADLPGAESAANNLRAALDLGAAVGRAAGWTPPVLSTVALDGQGVPELAQAIQRHRRYLQESGEGGRRERGRLRRELLQLLRQRLADRFLAAQPDGAFEAALDRTLQRQLTPAQAVEKLVAAG